MEHFDTVMSRNDSCIDQIGAELIQAESPMSNVLQLLLLPFDPNTPIVNVIGNIFAGKMKFEHFELIMAYHASIIDSNMILAGHAKRRRCEMEKKVKLAFISVTKDAPLCAFMQALEPETATQTVVNDSPIVLAATVRAPRTHTVTYSKVFRGMRYELVFRIAPTVSIHTSNGHRCKTHQQLESALYYAHKYSSIRSYTI